jgi:hypothetical protein
MCFDGKGAGDIVQVGCSCHHRNLLLLSHCSDWHLLRVTLFGARLTIVKAQRQTKQIQRGLQLWTRQMKATGREAISVVVPSA